MVQVKIGDIIQYGDKKYKIGELISTEDIIELKERNENVLVYIQPCNRDYEHEEGVASVKACDDRLEIMSLSKDSNGVPWYVSISRSNSLSIGTWLDAYELTDITNEDSKDTYYGDEILKMIREGKLKEGDKIIAHEEAYDISLIIYKNPNGTLHIEEIEENGDGSIDSWDLLNMTFQLKQKEYLTLDEARKSGKKFKYKNWAQFQNIREVMLDLSTYDDGSISIMLNEKAWEVEE